MLIYLCIVMNDQCNNYVINNIIMALLSCFKLISSGNQSPVGQFYRFILIVRIILIYFHSLLLLL